MISRLLLLFILVPFIELVVLLQVHHAISQVAGPGIGLLMTLGTIVVTGIAGAALARQQGLGVINQVRQRMSSGQVPGQALADGILILIGAALLLTPGFLTDIVGFSFLIPATRKLYRAKVLHWFQHHVRIQRAGGIDVFVVDSVQKQEQLDRDRIDIR